MKVKDILPTDYKIFQDLDGCLADFRSKAIEVTGIDIEATTDKKIINDFWKQLKQYNTQGHKFFEEMELLPDAMQLWNYIKKHNPVICSSSGNIPHAESEKRTWVRNHLGNTPAHTALFVHAAKEKAKYAAPNHILIDDRSKSIDPWGAAGGIGILHTSAANTISQLKKFGL